MFFTKAGRVIAWLAIILGASRIVMGFALVDGDPAALARYLGSGTTGQAIDRGIYAILFGIALGIVTDISKAVAANTERNGKGA